MEPVQSFIDVKEKAEYYDAVQWAVANGIASGLTRNTFSPGVAISLKQLANALYQVSKLAADAPGAAVLRLQQ